MELYSWRRNTASSSEANSLGNSLLFSLQKFVTDAVFLVLCFDILRVNTLLKATLFFCLCFPLFLAVTDNKCIEYLSFCAISPCFCCWELIFCLISGFCGYHLVEKNTAGTWITYNHVRKAINSNYTIFGFCALKVPKALVSSNAQTKCKLIFGFFPNFLLYLNVCHPLPPILWKGPTATYTFPHLHIEYHILLQCPHL